MAHFIYGFLHELNGCAELSSDDSDEYAKWLTELTGKNFSRKMEIGQPLMVVARQGETRVFTHARETHAGFLGFLEPVVTSPSDSWGAALHVATVMVAAEMHLYGAAAALHEPNEGNNRLWNTPRDTIVHDILHDMPAHVAAQYQACVDAPCCGHPSVDQDMLSFRRTHDAGMFECFIRSFVPPFTRNAMGWYQFYRCLDLRHAVLRGKCGQGDEASPYGDFAITFAHVNE